MLFSTFPFIIFIFFFFLFYHSCKKHFRKQNLILLLGSYLFYIFWDIRFLFILIIPTTLDYILAIMIEHGKVQFSQRIKSAGLLLGSFLVLVFIQYNAISVSFINGSLSFGINYNSLIHPHGIKLLAAIILLLFILNILFSVSTKWDNAVRRKFYLIVSIVINLALLCFFKYFNFFADSFLTLTKNIFGIESNPTIIKILLPVGISFYIFKTISYIVDVYRNDVESSESLLDFATYLAFFPQLLAGPIERAGKLIPQLKKMRPDLKSQDLKEAVWLFVWGLFKKVVVADNISVIVNKIFGPYDILASPVSTPEDGLRMLVGIYAFTIQIYGDFSGYTDMSRGIAKLLGFNTMRNFNLPYFSKTPGEFWRRWHMSLSFWLRDYLYIPLGGNRCSKLRININLMITMILGGLWHGASWTFVLWGGYHGILLVIYRIFGIEEKIKSYQTWKKVFNGFITFNLVAFGWLLFRAKNMTTVVVFLQSIFTNPFGSFETWEHFTSLIGFTWFLLLFQIFQAWSKKLEPVYSYNWFIQFNIYLYILFALIAISPVGEPEFIYFAF